MAHNSCKDVLEIIRIEQCSPTKSMEFLKDETDKHNLEHCDHCLCKNAEKQEPKIDTAFLENLIKEKEKQLKFDFEQHLEKEINTLKERFEFILQNEQVRTSYMLREAHRERQEKIAALTTQLECKNLAGLMYLMCTERRKSKLEKLRLIEEYSNYIHVLQDILTEGQALILHLSRGYKAAARVDHEWRTKMKKIIGEFQKFVHHYVGGTAESNQYLFDLPSLLKCEASIQDNSEEDSCEEEEIIQKEEEIKDWKPWWDQLDGDCRPFVMFGDMADFKPPQRREVLKAVKAAKTAPRKWKEYVFHDMFVKSNCPNSDFIKDEYLKRIPSAPKWECHGVQTQDPLSPVESNNSRRGTTLSSDAKGMGSIIKLINASNQFQPPTKATLLGARDSMEIASTTKLKEKHRVYSEHKEVVLNIGSKKFSHEVIKRQDYEEETEEFEPNTIKTRPKMEECDSEEYLNGLGTHNDSLHIIPGHKPDKDHKINYEKVCPMEKCQRLQVDSFMRSLPAYMRANPFTHYRQNYDEYETCSPEQLYLLKQRIEDKKKKEKSEPELKKDPLAEWSEGTVEGVAVQTSNISMSLPPCTCRVPSPTPASSTGMIFNVAHILPLKAALDEINKECFYDDRIQFDRFKVIGQPSEATINDVPNQDFTQTRLQQIRMILKQHPSLCEMFQANYKC